MYRLLGGCAGCRILDNVKPTRTRSLAYFRTSDLAIGVPKSQNTGRNRNLVAMGSQSSCYEVAISHLPDSSNLIGIGSYQGEGESKHGRQGAAWLLGSTS